MCVTAAAQKSHQGRGVWQQSWHQTVCSMAWASWTLLHFVFSFLQIAGEANQWGGLWLSQGGGQWGRRSGGRRSLPDPFLPQLQEWGWSQGHVQETDGCLRPEKSRLLDCRGIVNTNRLYNHMRINKCYTSIMVAEWEQECAFLTFSP